MHRCTHQGMKIYGNPYKQNRSHTHACHPRRSALSCQQACMPLAIRLFRHNRCSQSSWAALGVVVSVVNPHQRRYAMKNCFWIALFSFLVLSSPHVLGAEISVSDATTECMDCHVEIHPGIVQDWQKSRHAKTTPQKAATRRY